LNKAPVVTLPADFAQRMCGEGTVCFDVSAVDNNLSSVITSLGSQGSTTGTDLQGMNGSLTTNYALGADIDASGTTSWYTSASLQGFLKIGDNTSSATYYSGTFAGLGHVISDLYLYRPNVGVSGLFAVLSSAAVVRDTGMVNMAITTNSSGGLVGRNYGTVKNSYTTGSITSKAGFVGGLVGDNNTTGIITNSYSTATVTASVAIHMRMKFNCTYWARRTTCSLDASVTSGR
jgi:hypothetical protein